MRWLRRKTTWLAGPAGLLLAVAVLAWTGRPDPLREEYPDAPFAPVGDDFPRIISVTEAPSRQDEKAYAEYQKERQKVREFLLEKGAMSRATAEEREAYRVTVSEEKYVHGRELVQAVLENNPESIPARLAQVVIEEQGEGSFPRALFLVRKLRRQLHRRGLEAPDDADAREWYLRVLEREYLILTDLDRSEEQLRVLDLLEQVYQPLPWRRVWPLMKLKRFDEAWATVSAVEATGQMKSSLANYRLALESEIGHRHEAYEAGKQAVAAHPDSCVLWKNFAGAAVSDFRFREAEEAIVRAANTRVDYHGSPYVMLAGVYADQGRMVEAWDALKKAQDQRRQRPPYTLEFDQARLDGTAAAVLLRLGRTVDALHFARRPLETPGRLGSSSTNMQDADLARRFFLLVALQCRLEEMREQAAAGAADAGAAARAAVQMECWTLQKQVCKRLDDDAFLVKMLRPSMPGVPSPDTLLLASLARLLPAGVRDEALRRARQEEEHPAAVPYFDAVQAELAWVDGQDEEALSLAQRALAGLDATYEKALRARVAVVAGESARRLGRQEQAQPYFEQALRDCPVVFRLLGVAIPIQVADDGSEPAEQLARRLLASPRFRDDPAGFPVTIRCTGTHLAFALHRRDGVQHFEDQAALGDELSAAVQAAHLRFHARTLSPLLDLRETDINYLENALFSAPPGNEIDHLLRLLPSARLLQ